jgi:hypothetical protein
MGDNATIHAMEQNALQPGCWPTEMQELLLKACLLEGRAATQAWEKWKSRIDIDWIDEGSNRLLPLLYHNLSPLGIEDPILTRAKGVYRYQLTKTHIMFHRVMPLISELQKEGVEVILLKGSALILNYYKNFGIRPQLDIDIMVKPENVDRAAFLMQQQGLRCEYQQSISTIKRFRHSCGFAAGAEKRLDLHWNIMHPSSDKDTVSTIWQLATVSRYQDYSLLTMCPTHHLLHSCTHGLRWNQHAPCRWIADAIMILNNAESTIDWKMLNSFANDLQVSVVLQAAFKYLNESFQAGIPDTEIAELEANPINRLERAAFYVHTRNKSKVYGNLLKYTVDYMQYESPKGFLKKVANYPRYLQICWNTKTLLLMPFELISQVVSQKVGRWKSRRAFTRNEAI